MLRIRCLLAVLLLPVLWGRTPAQPADAAADEQLLRQANLPTDNAGLLRFFQSRTAPEADQEKLAVLVRGLGAASYGAREQAAAALLKAGSLARPLLKQALANTDQEIARRAALCLRRLDQHSDALPAAAAARLLAQRKPSGAARVLLNYLPFAPDSAVADDVCRALKAVAVREGRPEPTVNDALKDPLAVKRGAAGAALAGVPEQLPAVRVLLDDADPLVRLQVALALVEARHKDAVPVLIDLIAVLPDTNFWQVEEVLLRLAGEHAPKLTRDDATPAKQVRDAWAAWWKKQGSTLDLARLTGPSLLGHTLMTQMLGQGQVFEVGHDGKVRWQINGLVYPLDAQILGDNRVLVAEYLGRRVTERDFQGNVLWQYNVHMPISCQRLPGGNTFIATRRMLLVVDRAGKDVFTYGVANTSITAARRLRNGQMVLVESGGTCKWLDARGEVLKSFTVGAVYAMGGNIDVLPGGRVLVPEFGNNRVVEYDAAGKTVWQAAVTNPCSAVRLADGHTLVVSMSRQRVVELDAGGQEVWQFQTQGRPWRARRR